MDLGADSDRQEIHPLSTFITLLVIAAVIAAGTWYHYWATPRVKDNHLLYRGQAYALGQARATVQIDRHGWRSQKAQAWIHVESPHYVISCLMKGKGASVTARANEIAATINNASQASVQWGQS